MGPCTPRHPSQDSYSSLQHHPSSIQRRTSSPCDTLTQKPTSSTPTCPLNSRQDTRKAAKRKRSKSQAAHHQPPSKNSRPPNPRTTMSSLASRSNLQWKREELQGHKQLLPISTKTYHCITIIKHTNLGNNLSLQPRHLEEMLPKGKIVAQGRLPRQCICCSIITVLRRYSRKIEKHSYRRQEQAVVKRYRLLWINKIAAIQHLCLIL